MSDLDFELDIEKYTTKELEQLLNIKFPYTPEDIEESIVILQKKILSDKELENNKQKEIVNFLRKIDNKLNKALLDRKNQMQQNVITQYGSNFIIDRNSQRERDPNGIPPSVKINPYRTGPGDAVSLLSGWEDGTTTELLSIDSRFRNQYFATTSTDFLVTLPLSINNVVSMELVALEIPATYFAINKRLGSNFFHIWQPDLSDVGPTLGMKRGTLYKIALPDGNYSRDEMENELNLMFTAAMIPGERAPQASIDRVSGRTIIDLGLTTSGIGLGHPARFMYFNLDSKWAENGPLNLDRSPHTPQYSSQAIQTKLGWILGYRVAHYEGYTLSGVAPFLNNCPVFISEGIFDGWGSRYFYFVVDDFNKNSVNGMDAILNASVISDNILARLTRGSIGSALNTGFTLDSSLLKSDDATRRRVYFGPINIKKLHIRIIDSLGRTIDLNNMDISFALRLNRLYD